MHKYFLIPIIIFFGIISLIIIYTQFFHVDWKYAFIPENFDARTGKYIELEYPKICEDKEKVLLINSDLDKFDNRFFMDQVDQSNDYSFHAIYLLPCEVEDRKFDINKDIHFSLEKINKWFLEKSDNQIINFDKTENNFIDTTFIRVNKTLDWFTRYNSVENSREDAASKIENIILSNSHIFNNFKKKKFIVFFEGWEKRVSISVEACGRSRLNGQVSIFYTNTKFNTKTKSCTKDNINKLDKITFGESEETILHEILHTLGAPFKCGKNIDPDVSLHVNDNKGDIMNKVSGSLYLDFNNDDYYKHNISDCNDLYMSKFLTNLNG